MQVRLPLCSLATLLCALPALAQNGSPAAAELSPAAAAIVAASRAGSQVMRPLDYLTNAIGGRLTGSQDLVQACEWAVDELKSMGLQNVHLESWGEVPVAFDRGPWFGAMYWQDGETTQREVLEFNTPAWSAGTKGLRRGKAVLVPTTEAQFQALGAQLRDAWVVLPPNAASGRRSPRGGAAADAAAPAPSFDGLKACEAAGILGTIRSSGDQYLRTGGNRQVDWRKVDIDRLPTQAQVQMVPDQYKQLVAMLENGAAVELEFNIQNRFRKGPVKLYNVVGDIVGSDKPDEFVLLGGHIDSWDGATGAVDDASGVSTAMEACRLILASKQRPKRTVRIVLWSGEEQGLLGSAAYCDMHKDEMAKVSVYLNHDSGTNFVSGAPCTKAMKADLEQVFAGVSSIDADMPFALRESEGLRGGGSDHGSLLAAGVPAWSWQLTGNHNYGHIWHTQHDLYDEVVENYQRHSAMVIAIAAVGIANLDHLLSRDQLAPPAGAGNRRGSFNAGITLDGTKVTAVDANGAFAKAGFKPGDVLQKAGDTEVTGVRDIFSVAFRAEGPIKVTVQRDGKPVELTLTIERRRQ